MIVAHALLGQRSDPAFAGRLVDALVVGSRDAERRRLAGRTEGGREIRIDLVEGGFLADGAVLHDDGDLVIVVARAAEEAVVVRLQPAGSAEDVEGAVLLGHALGNRHVPIEVVGDEVRVPITTSSRLALDTVRAAAPPSASVELARVPLALRRPLWRRAAAGPAHAHGHSHDAAP